jgi:twitching motility protein PilT
LISQLLTQEAVGRLREGAWGDPQERDLWIQRALGPQGTMEPQELIDLLFVRDLEIRKAALLRIHDLGFLTTVDAFLMAARQQTPRTLRGAAQALARVLPRGWQSRAAQYLEHPEERLREAADALLCASPVSEDLFDAAPLWASPSCGAAARLVPAVLDALERGDAPLESALRALRLAAQHELPEVKEAATLALARWDEDAPLEALALALQAAAGPGRAALEEALRRQLERDDAHASARLAAMLLGDDPDAARAAAAAAALSPRLPRLIERVAHEGRALPLWRRERAMEALRALGDPITPVARALLGSADPAVRAQALALLEDQPPSPALLPALLAALEQPEWWPRARALRLLARLDDPGVVPALARALEDRDGALLALEALAAAARRWLPTQPAAAARALSPLLALLAEGRADAPEDRLRHELRAELLRLAPSLHADALFEPLLQTARQDRDPALQRDALDAAERLGAALGQRSPEIPALRLEIDARALRGARLTELDLLLQEGRAQLADEIHVCVGRPPLMRRQGRWAPLAEGRRPLHAERTAHMLRAILSPAQARRVATHGSLSCCHEVPRAGRFRAQISVDQRGVNALFRALPEAPPDLLGARAPALLRDAAAWPHGLVLLCAPRGAGRTSTLAAIIEQLHAHAPRHTLHLGAPIEYLHHPRLGRVTQRDLASHAASAAAALRGALTQGADVVVLDDLQDADSARLLLKLARGGALVFAGLQAPHAVEGLRRLLALFPLEERPEARLALARSLRAVFAQALLPRRDGHGLVAAFETLDLQEDARATLLRGDLDALALLLQRRQGHNLPLDRALLSLCHDGLALPEDALRRAVARDALEPLLRREPGA